MENKKTFIKGRFGLKRLSIIMAVLTIVSSFFMFYLSVQVTKANIEVKNASDEYIDTQMMASQLKQGSDSLTKHVRSYVVTGQLKFLDYYFTEINDTRSYADAYAQLSEIVQDDTMLASMDLIQKYENKLLDFEGRAILLALDYYDQDVPQYAEYLQQFRLSPLEESLEPEEKLKKAITLVFGDTSSNGSHYGDYEMNKRIIDENIDSFIRKMATISKENQDISIKNLDDSAAALQRTVVGAFIFLLFIVYVLIRYVVNPLTRNVALIDKHAYLEEKGVQEVKVMAHSYNQMLQQVNDDQEKLSYEACHDALTGLLNRQAYLDNLPAFNGKNICFLHIDVDNFKNINDEYGHDVGDRFLKKIAEILRDSFRSNDLIYRLGGDEFAVVMVGVRDLCEPIITTKAQLINERLGKGEDGLPPSSVSIGASFARDDGNVSSMYKEADLALYEAKNSGKGQIRIYEEYMDKKQ